MNDRGFETLFADPELFSIFMLRYNPTSKTENEFNVSHQLGQVGTQIPTSEI